MDTYTLWIIDDDNDDLEFLKFLFERNPDFSLTGLYESAPQAICDLIDNEPPDIILTDLYMPIMSGAELCVKIFSENLLPGGHIFVISGIKNKPIEKTLSKYKQIHFLEKPVDLSHINNVPAKILEVMGVPGKKKKIKKPL